MIIDAEDAHSATQAPPDELYRKIATKAHQAIIKLSQIPQARKNRRI